MPWPAALWQTAQLSWKRAAPSGGVAGAAAVRSVGREKTNAAKKAGRHIGGIKREERSRLSFTR
jgi:hypothetical protein